MKSLRRLFAVAATAALCASAFAASDPTYTALRAARPDGRVIAVNNFTFDTELDVLVATIRMMPHFIERPIVNGRRMYVVPNEATMGENFAERWNAEPERTKAFYDWHAKALADFEKLDNLEGLDLITMGLDKSLGSNVVRKVMDARTNVVSEARSARKLYVAPVVGLTLSSGAQATVVPRNTHFGD